MIVVIKNIKISSKTHMSTQFERCIFRVKEVLKLRIGYLETIFRWSKFDKGSP